MGQGALQIDRALRYGGNAFRFMNKPGRQRNGSRFIGSEIDACDVSKFTSIRGGSWSSEVALATIDECWADAKLAEIDPSRIGLIVGGTNLQQRDLVLLHDAYRDRFEFLRPGYGRMFLDSDIGAICSEIFNITGTVYTVGGASASGHLSIIKAIHAVQSGEVDACIALGALTDLSYWECQGFRALGAMGSERYSDAPEQACRPFDRGHDGFIYGESCGAVVIERLKDLRSTPYAAIAGWSFVNDGHRNPDPSLDGEIQAIRIALEASGLSARDIDYINPHGTGSYIGDHTELRAFRACGLEHAAINATKSILGHGISSAGTVEVIATLLQMRNGYLHPTRNLLEPIDNDFHWIRGEAVPNKIQNALCMSFGFGGISSAICLKNLLF